MASKKISHSIFFIAALFLAAPAATAQTALGEFVTINTNLRCIFATPRWLLILRDRETGQVLPYVYDFYQPNNNWLALTYGHSYQVTASRMSFGPLAAINNFCGLEHYQFAHVSLYISLTGALTPDRNSSKCHVTFMKDYPLVIAGPSDK